MAYMNQTEKKRLAPKIKAVLKKYNVKGSISVRNSMALVVTLKEGAVKLPEFRSVHNPYSYNAEREYEGETLLFLRELYDAMNDNNHNNSDIQTDYFDVGWYTDIYVGRDYYTPYVYTG